MMLFALVDAAMKAAVLVARVCPSGSFLVQAVARGCVLLLRISVRLRRP